MLLTRFEPIRPPFETAQEQTLEWLADAHTEAERKAGNGELEAFRAQFKEKLRRVGCKPEAIAMRGHVLADPQHTDWEKMLVYSFQNSPNGADLSVRSSHFSAYVDEIFEQYYPVGSQAPDDLIHVSCTGYVSPSGGQKVVSKRNWGPKTTVTHAYHMGCYASIPALRMAQGFLAASLEKQRVDIVHTELCSLHSNPANHNLDQLVSQSLFADGCVQYTALRQTDESHLRVEALLEEIIPDSIGAMSWNVAHWGFEMTLAREVPVLIARALEGFFERLAAKAKRNPRALLGQALFAVHPGGPKILTQIKEWFKLSDEQLGHSASVLRRYGNMSSATIPHIWNEVLSDTTIPNEVPIVSLAFGPGLSIAGAILVKSLCGS